MLDLAEALNPLLDARKQRQDAGDLGDDEDEDVIDTTLQLVFFDGEEAFVSWTATDSIYGARRAVPTSGVIKFAEPFIGIWRADGGLAIWLPTRSEG